MQEMSVPNSAHQPSCRNPHKQPGAVRTRLAAVAPPDRRIPNQRRTRYIPSRGNDNARESRLKRPSSGI